MNKNLITYRPVRLRIDKSVIRNFIEEMDQTNIKNIKSPISTIIKFINCYSTPEIDNAIEEKSCLRFLYMLEELFDHIQESIRYDNNNKMIFSAMPIYEFFSVYKNHKEVQKDLERCIEFVGYHCDHSEDQGHYQQTMIGLKNLQEMFKNLIK